MIDNEKAPTTPVVSAVVHGVTIESRWQKHHELVLLSRLVSALAPDLRQQVDALWCDSKCGACYSVVMKPGYDRSEITRQIGRQLAETLMEISGGHNGLWIGESTVIDPQWLWSDLIA